MTDTRTAGADWSQRDWNPSRLTERGIKVGTDAGIDADRQL
jgi:hypothetical protein